MLLQTVLPHPRLLGASVAASVNFATAFVVCSGRPRSGGTLLHATTFFCFKLKSRAGCSLWCLYRDRTAYTQYYHDLEPSPKLGSKPMPVLLSCLGDWGQVPVLKGSCSTNDAGRWRSSRSPRRAAELDVRSPSDFSTSS